MLPTDVLDRFDVFMFVVLVSTKLETNNLRCVSQLLQSAQFVNITSKKKSVNV